MYWPQGCANTGTMSIQRAGPKCEYIFQNNSSIIFSCIRTSANTGSTCIRAKINSSRFFSCMYRFCAGGNLHIQNFIVTAFPQKKKKRFWTIFLSAPNLPPPHQQRKCFFHCRLAVSDTCGLQGLRCPLNCISMAMPADSLEHCQMVVFVGAK